MQRELDDGKDLFLVESERLGISLSPRVIIIGKGGDIPLVPYKATKWLGLPGGKVKETEALEDVNFLSVGSFPTLAREVWEECGIDILNCLNKAACLGLAEIGIVDSVNQQVRLTYTPIFVCINADLGNVNTNTQLVNIESHLPGTLFHDARAGLSRLKEGIGRKEGLILPEFLNDGKIYYFEIRPQMRPLVDPPDWARLLLTTPGVE